MFVTRKSLSEVLLLHRSPEQGSYWHVVAGGVETGEAVEEAAERELREETGLVANVTRGFALAGDRPGASGARTARGEVAQARWPSVLSSERSQA